MCLLLGLFTMFQDLFAINFFVKRKIKSANKNFLHCDTFFFQRKNIALAERFH